MTLSKPKYILFVLFLFICSIPSFAQSWRPDFRIPLGPEAIRLHPFYNELHYYLAKGVTAYENVRPCKDQLSMFYFRVNSQGKIDSMYAQGNLDKLATEAVYKNIYETEGKWVLPKDTKSTDSCWFVYPLFAFGSSRSCPKELLENCYPLSLLHRLLLVSKSTEDQWGRVLLPPNQIASLSEK